MFQLGKHSTVKGNITAPVRSSSALVLSSTNINRERIYVQQPPISASGYSSQAFAPHYPHTERKTETKTCTDCHLSENNDNNAIMAQLLLQGTNFVNFVGFNAWVGEDGGIEAVNVTEWDEPQAVIGSYLHRYAYPSRYEAHQKAKLELPISFSQSGGETGCLQLRGEYVLAAQGSSGMTAYDVASIANKGVSDRILSGPVSPLGQNLHISSEDATCVVLPTNQPIHPDRNQGDLMRKDNQEQPFHPIYNYAFITDRVEGLIATDVNTLVNNQPSDNFLTRALTWNEGGVLTGARHLTIAGTWFYVAADAGLVVLDMDDPMAPKLVTVLPLQDVRATAVQFRYLFALDGEGLKVVDVTHPDRPKLVEGAAVPLADARRIYVARTYAYIAAGAEGLVIVDVERPEAPALYTRFTADGTLERRQRRDRRHHQRVAVRLRRRRQERAQGAAADLAREPAQLLRLQPRAQAAADRDQADAQAGAGAVQGPGPRPGGRRDRPPDGGVRPARLAPVHQGGDGQALSGPERQPVVRDGQGRRTSRGGALMVPPAKLATLWRDA